MAESEMSGHEPGTNDTTHQRDWEAQRERLSAYLDGGQLPADERAALERHLSICARCTAELADLRRTVALLRALPAPALPRSFALPESAAIVAVGGRELPTDGVDRERADVAPTALAARLPGRTRPGGRPPHWSGIAQWAGGLAAVAGLVVLLGGAFSGLPQGSGSAAGLSAAGPSHVAPQTQATEHTLPMTPSASGTGDATNQTLKPSPAATGSTVQTPQASSYGPLAPGSTSSPLPVLPLAGGGLVLGGGLVFAAGRLARRRT